MGSIRKIRRVVTGNNQIDGAGVKLVRVIGRPDVEDFDPFLMLDAFDSRHPADYIKGFPWHPHRGIETVTYLIAGNIEHGDSLGNTGNILDGCCQWMTAGSGILHQEMPQASLRMQGVQLWVNLPRKDKMTRPEYRDISAEMIPDVREDGVVVRVISGNYAGKSGATKGDYVNTILLDVALDAGSEWTLPVDPSITVFVYLFSGAGFFGADEQNVESRSAALFDAGDQIAVKASAEGVRFLLCAGHPLKEPIAWGGPIVMNTRQELHQAFEELDNETFIKENGKR
jgi:redox-sensitive bicupin YhaK (pirin superfamily)